MVHWCIDEDGQSEIHDVRDPLLSDEEEKKNRKSKVNAIATV
jgi:hypothetical protein